MEGKEKISASHEQPSDAERLRDITSAVVFVLPETNTYETIKRTKSQLEELECEFLEKYPDYQEEIVALFRLPRSVWDDYVARKKKKFSRFGDLEVTSLAEQNYLLTHFVLHNQRDKRYLVQFWTAVYNITIGMGAERFFDSYKRGILAQVAAFNLLEAVGFKPKLSSPKEDIRPGIDFWAEHEGLELAVQVKGHVDMERSYSISGTDEVSFFGKEEYSPSVKRGKFIAKDRKEFLKFAIGVDRVNERTKRNIEPFLIALPENEIDIVTGEPSAKLFEQVTGREKT